MFTLKLNSTSSLETKNLGHFASRGTSISVAPSRKAYVPGKTVALQEESRKVKLNALATETAAAVESEEIFCKFGTLNGFSKENYDELYKKSVESPGEFWSESARKFHWNSPWPTSDKDAVKYNLDVREGPVNIEWFKGGTTNIAFNALDRQIAAGRGNQKALIWEGNEPGLDYTLTYQELLEKVCQLANYLRSVGVGKGDFVAIYMPMLAELPIAMLACARIGAVHSVIFGGFSSEAVAERVMDCKPKTLLTCSAVMRGSKPIGLKTIVDKALSLCSEQGFSLGHVLVYDNPRAISRESTGWTVGRDVWWQDVVPTQPKEAEVEWVDAEDPLFLLYTSGSTGRPKGVLHTTGGYMVYTATTFKYTFEYREGDVYWCTADCGWITGHSYVAYGPLLNGAQVVVFEGVPNYPDWGRTWEIVDKHQVSIFYTAPTAIRAQMKAGNEFVRKYSRSSLRVLGSVGEPINPAAWKWYYEVVGDSRCPISDTWWQTETGGFMITPMAGAWGLKPGSATLPFFGVQPAVVNEKGEELEGECEGYLCVKAAWPSAFRTLYGDHERYQTTYFAPFKGYYFSGDGCRRDADGYYWLTGRVDDVINVSGHRIGTAEVESALVADASCAEAAVVGVDHEIKGQSIYAFITLMEGVEPSDAVKKSLITTVRAKIGAFAAPDVIHWAPGLPKTRSGKIMRRILRKIAGNQISELGDTSTLADPSVVQQLIDSRSQ